MDVPSFIKRSNNNGSFINTGLRIIGASTDICGILPHLRQRWQCQSEYGTVFFQRLHGTGFLRLCFVWTVEAGFIVVLPDVFGQQFGKGE